MIRIYEIAASSVLTPPAGRARIFLDSADNLIKARLDDGSLIVLSVTTEYIQDIVGSFFQDSGTINFTYDDNGNVASMDVFMSALDISQIPNVPSGNLTATNVQAALNELQSSIDDANSDIAQEISDRQSADTALQDQIDDIIATDAENAQDATAAAFAAGTQDGVSVTYNDVANSFDVTNTDKGSVARAAHEAAIDPHPQYQTASESQAQVDAHANLTNNPHNVTKAQVGLGNVPNIDTSIAANISNVPAGNIGATNVQAAINELDLEKQPIDADLTAVANLTGTGLVTRTAAGTMTTRSIQATPGEVTISNGDGVSGNPTVGLPDVGVASSVGAANSTISITTDAKGRVTAKSVQLISIISSQVTDFAASVLGTLLAGFTVGANTALAATDSVLVAFGKVQGQLNALFNRNINTGTGLQGGGNLTADRTLSLTNTGVAAATYGSDGLNVGQFTVDAQGRLTSAQNTPITFGRHYQVFEDTVQSNSNSGAQPLTAVASSFTTTALTAGDYFLVIQYYWSNNSGANDARFQLFVDGVAIGNQHNQELQDQTTNQIDQIIENLTLTDGTHTIELRFGGEGGSTTTINRVVCQLWRVA